MNVGMVGAMTFLDKHFHNLWYDVGQIFHSTWKAEAEGSVVQLLEATLANMEALSSTETNT